MPDDEHAEERELAPAFAKDTPFNKVLRFGCGAILGGLIVVGVLMFGLLQPFGATGVIIGSVIAVGVSGLVSVTHGEAAIRVLLKLIRWLA